MDLMTIIGLVLSLAIVGVVMVMDGGSPAELFAHPGAILLTMGGAIAATLISYPMKSLANIPKWFMLTVMGPSYEAEEAIQSLTQMADKARREGLLALEEESKKVDDEFLQRGLMMVVDGVDPSQVRAILEIEIHHLQERHEQGGINFFSAAGGYGPTMGIIGTVMGLISVLQELDNPGELGASIAAAFLATLWGILSANIIWLPLAGKLRHKSEEEVAYRRLLLEGILALQSGENPRIVKDKLNAFLPPKSRSTGEPAAEGAPAGKKAKAAA
jgi:chemotaxis protein MotA